VSTTAAEVDLDEIEQKIQARIGELQRRRQELSIQALSDKSVATEMVTIERRLGAAQVELQRVDLARAEQERLNAEARQAQVDEHQAAALERARGLQPKREKAAAAVDKAAVAHVEAVCAFVEVCRSQQAELREAGRPDTAQLARPFGYGIEAAFAYAMREATTLRANGLRGIGVWERLPFIPPMHQKPLAESDVRPIEHLGE
jgi:hypothetical protein